MNLFIRDVDELAARKLILHHECPQYLDHAARWLSTLCTIWYRATQVTSRISFLIVRGKLFTLLSLNFSELTATRLSLYCDDS